MRNPLLLLSSLALASAASAQTVVLAPVALSGFYQSGSKSSTSTLRLADLLMTLPHSLQPALQTKYVYASGTHYGVHPEDSRTLYSYAQMDRQGWFAEFLLPVTPSGMGLAAAILKASAVGLADKTGMVATIQTITVGAYAGDGKATLADFPGDRGPTGLVASTVSQAVPGPVAVNVTGGIGTLLGKGSAYAGLRVERSGYQYENTVQPIARFDLMAWSSPTLTLVYGYPVRAALSLQNFYGDATKVPVAYEVRKPGTREVVASGTAYPDATGAVFPVVPPGTWDVSLKPSHWLRRTLKSVVVADGASGLPLTSFANGDVNGDNVVSAADRAKVTAALGSAKGDALYSEARDLTGDGYVTAKDRAIVTAALGTAGDD